MSEIGDQFADLSSEPAALIERDHELVMTMFTHQVALILEDRDITQAELARLLGVSRARVSQMMRHRSSVTVRTMVEVAAALGCHLEIKLLASEAPRRKPPRGGITERLNTLCAEGTRDTEFVTKAARKTLEQTEW